MLKIFVFGNRCCDSVLRFCRKPNNPPSSAGGNNNGNRITANDQRQPGGNKNNNKNTNSPGNNNGGRISDNSANAAYDDYWTGVGNNPAPIPDGQAPRIYGQNYQPFDRGTIHSQFTRNFKFLLKCEKFISKCLFQAFAF